MDVLSAEPWSAAARARYAELYADSSRSLDELVRIEDAAFYVNPLPVYQRMQTEAPAFFYEPFNTWILTKHADVQYASRHHEIFSCEHGILLYDGIKQGSGIGDLFAGGGDLIGLTDPPRHGELRRIMQPPFTPPALARLQNRTEAYCDRLLDRIEPGEPFDWVAEVASRLPIIVIAAILGIPDDDEAFFEQVRVWTNATEELVSRDLTKEELAHTLGTFDSLNVFINEVFEEKRRNPDEGFLSSLLTDRLDNAKLSERNLVGFAQLLIAAGADTSRSLLSEAVAQLCLHPEQRELLVNDRALIPNAIEEVLRFSPAARGFARQLVEDTTMHGMDMQAGQRVYMSYDAANRDPDVFDRPNEFDVTRASNRKNLAFGFGAHVCIAAPLVRAQTQTLLENLLTRFPRFELAGKGKRVESFLRNGWVELPVRFYGN
jgi:cytochrome P450